MGRGEVRRKAHTKSRGGCQRCKARKVKCDELRPQCSSCQKHDVLCEYTSLEPSQGLKATVPEVRDGRTRSPRSPVSAATQTGQIRSQERLQELRLMHHYSTVTCQQPFISTHDEAIRDIYVHLAPRLALEHDYLMDAILATAALHIYKIDPQTNHFAQEVHRRYFESAVVRQRHAINHLNAENGEALCITAGYISFQALCMQQDNQRYVPPSLWLDLSTGIITLFAAAWSYTGENSRILGFVYAEPQVTHLGHKTFDKYPNDVFPSHIEIIFPRILEFKDALDENDLINHFSEYKYALGFVGMLYQKVEAGEEPSKIRRLLTAFGAVVPPSFKKLVGACQARALVILAHYFAVMKAADEVWWLRGVPEREVLGIQSLLPERWQWAMSWPIQKLTSYAAASIPSTDIP